MQGVLPEYTDGVENIHYHAIYSVWRMVWCGLVWSRCLWKAIVCCVRVGVFAVPILVAPLRVCVWTSDLLPTMCVCVFFFVLFLCVLETGPRDAGEGVDRMG